jgi:SAM-dependent methyltransferase
MLVETDLFVDVQEGRAYLDAALERFRIPLALVPPMPSDAAVLELGSNPYFLTRLLRQRGLQVRSANWFGHPKDWAGDAWAQVLETGTGSQRVTESGIPHRYEFDHFNIEQDRFPYDDDSYDLALFCEILEHLPCDPTHTLVELHRVLKPGGRLLLTTPNASRFENLIKVVRGENMYEALSGYGVYGRHNREYTVAELGDLLEGCGYDVEELFTRDIWLFPRPPELGPGVEIEHRGENLFAVARVLRPRRWYYPSWLYQSVHGYRRAVCPDLVVGVNCELQLGGVHKLERFGDRLGRWTDGASRTWALVAPQHGGSATLRVEGHTPDFGGTMKLTASLGAQERTWELTCDGDPFSVTAEFRVAAGEQEVRLWTDRSWRPCDVEGSADERVLGFVLHRVAVEPLFGSAVRPDLVVGVNCDAQVRGVHHLEEFDGRPGRWTDGTAETIVLLAPERAGPARLVVEGSSPNIGGIVRLVADHAGKKLTWAVPGDGRPFRVEASLDVSAGEQEVRLGTNRPWRPCDFHPSLDVRTLGFVLHTVALEPLAGNEVASGHLGFSTMYS